jgi:hypothetical protein
MKKILAYRRPQHIYEYAYGIATTYCVGASTLAAKSLNRRGVRFDKTKNFMFESKRNLTSVLLLQKIAKNTCA